MPKRPFQSATAADLTVRERVLLFCIASGTDWQKAGVPGETVIDVIEKGLIVDHPFHRLVHYLVSEDEAKFVFSISSVLKQVLTIEILNPINHLRKHAFTCDKLTRNEATTIFRLFIYVTVLRHNWAGWAPMVPSRDHWEKCPPCFGTRRCVRR
jgi:hypothetical protein